MALNSVAITPGAGKNIAVDTVTGQGEIPVSKIALGAEDAYDGLVSTALPLPVSDAGGSLTVDGTVAVSGTVPVSAASLPLPTGAATAAKQPALGTAGTPSADVISVQGAAGGTALPVSLSGSVDTELPAAAALGDNTANPTVPGVGSFPHLWDGAAWDRAPGTSADGLLVNLGANNDVTLGAALPAGTNNIGDVDVLTLPALPAGTNNIGDVDVLSIAAGDNNIGNVDIVSGPTGASALQVQGAAAHDAAVAGGPVLGGAEARTTDGTAVASGDAVRLQADVFGKQVVHLGALPELHFDDTTNFTNATAADLIAAQGAGVKIVVTSVLVTNAHATVATKVEIRAGTTVKILGYAAAAGGGFSYANPAGLFITAANEAVTGRCVTTGSDTDINVSGYAIRN